MILCFHALLFYMFVLSLETRQDMTPPTRVVKSFGQTSTPAITPDDGFKPEAESAKIRGFCLTYEEYAL